MNPKELETFWRFVCERHSIWHRRFVLDQDPPWTKDPILQKNKFTNVYRQLDPGTVFSIERIMKTDAGRRDIVFNVMMYRLMCSIPTYEGWGFHRLEEFSEKEFQEYLGEIYHSGRPVFGNAYLISPYSSMGSEFKYVNVARLFGMLQRNYDKFWENLKSAKTMEQAWKAINSQYGFGPFLAYQVLVDLTYPLRDADNSSILPFNQDDWAKLGPGAKRGFSRISSAYDQLAGLRELRRSQREAFDGLELDFPWLIDNKGREVEINLANMQNGLCEFHKYRSIQDGTGKSQRLYIP